jgi:lipopolysaccharide transport system ATP-binding protein
MSRPAIIVENLGKRYRIGVEARQFPTFREMMVNAMGAPFRRLRQFGTDGAAEGDRGTFWALRHVDFEIEPGEVVGIIGRNGAGKSTLLKILSRITEPTEGLIRLRGRVASLLEVGTGFHPELTGRENVTLSGSILGMKKTEIDSKFDRIVDFAEVSSFIDTPVKYYSSGMYVRLAFSVAAHLDPEVLIVDEVLAVGDANYQRKCIDRMSELAASGRTVLFVSHNMDLIPRLCDRAILLKAGQVDQVGPADQVTKDYLESQIVDSGNGDLTDKTRSGNGMARFVKLKVIDAEGRPISAHPSGDDLILEMEIESSREIPEAALAVALNNIQGMKVVTSWTKEVGLPIQLRPGRQVYRCHFRDIRLRPGQRICISLWMASLDVIDSVENAAIVDVVDGHNTADISNRPDQGIIVCPYTWSLQGDSGAAS